MSIPDDSSGADRSDGPRTSSGGVGPLPPGAMRVGDTERSSALEALGEHLGAGRITLDEYGDRSARVTTAKTADELAALFDDLPAPHPPLPGLATPGTAVAAAAPGGAVMPPARGQPPATGDTRSAAQKLVAAASAAAIFVALALFFITGWWYWFLLIPAISAIAGSIWGPDWKEPNPGDRDTRRQRFDDRHGYRRDRRNERRERRELDD